MSSVLVADDPSVADYRATSPETGEGSDRATIGRTELEGA